MRKIYCDRCGKEIKHEADVFNARILDITKHCQFIMAENDICSACARDIADYIKKEPILGPDRKQNKKNGRPRKSEELDLGKVKALKDAGWTVKSIAEEMNRDITEILIALRNS